MFLNYIKDFFIKRNVRKNLQNAKNDSFENKVKTVGLLIDESSFNKKEALIKEIKANGVSEKNLKIIVYRDKIKKDEVCLHPTFSPKHFDWRGEVNSQVVNDFMNEKFDLLISYYDIEKPVLLKLTNSSQSKFKAGFSSIDKRLNHFMINTSADNYKVFTHELFRYLKILNKI